MTSATPMVEALSLRDRLRVAIHLGTSMGARGNHASNIYNLAEEALNRLEQLEATPDPSTPVAEGIVERVSTAPAAYKQWYAEAIARTHKAEAALTTAQEALTKLSCPHVTEGPLWWQIEARQALASLKDSTP